MLKSSLVFLFVLAVSYRQVSCRRRGDEWRVRERGEEDKNKDYARPNVIHNKEWTKPSDIEETLQLVHVLFRHGHRTPNSLYPLYPDPDEKFYPYGFGELTNMGKRREYEIGKALRKRYNNFLGRIAGPNTVYGRSSAIPRTKKSLLLALAGLFPPRDAEAWHPSLDWQPIATNYEAMEKDCEFFGGFSVTMERLLEKHYKSECFKAVRNNYADAFKILSENTGLEITNFLKVMDLFFDFQGMSDEGLKLPEWVKQVWPNPMRNMSIEFYKSYTANDQMKKYAAGFMIKKILEDMTAKIQETVPSDRKIYMYSGHELNIAFMMRLLDVYFDHTPPFGAYLIFELHKINDEYAVKLLYQNYEGPNLQVLTIPGCEPICPLEFLIGAVQKYIPETEACEGAAPKPKKES